MQKAIEKHLEKTQNELPKNHRQRFENKLKEQLHSKSKKNYWFLKIAASLLLLISITYITFNTTKTQENAIEKISLGSLSPELEKIENYYVTAINYEILQLEINDETKPILEKYLSKIKQLTKQYKAESAQLSIDSINEKSINALIDNLQMRLQLLLQLKGKLQQIKNKKDESNKI
jgi:hypothetical protein